MAEAQHHPQDALRRGHHRGVREVIEGIRQRVRPRRGRRWRRQRLTGTTTVCSAEFGAERVFDSPISEEGIVGLGVGAAATGCRPIVDIMFMDFMGECMDEIANQLAKMRYMFGGAAKLPVTMLTMAGAGASLAAQHSQSLEAGSATSPASRS